MAAFSVYQFQKVRRHFYNDADVESCVLERTPWTDDRYKSRRLCARQYNVELEHCKNLLVSPVGRCYHSILLYVDSHNIFYCMHRRSFSLQGAGMGARQTA